MAVTHTDPNAFSTALCKAVGLDPNRVSAVRFEHTVNDWPRATFTTYVFDQDGLMKILDGEVVDVSFEWRRIES